MCFVNSTWSAKKDPNAKTRKKCKKLSNIENFFLDRFAHSAFYNIHIPGAADRDAPVQNAKYVFFFFFLSSHHDTNTLFHLYHFRKKYNYILANINSESLRVIFSFFFVFIQWIKHFCTPANFVTIWSTVLNNNKKCLYTTYVMVCQNCTLIFSRTRKQNWIIICQCYLRIWRARRGWGGG